MRYKQIDFIELRTNWNHALSTILIVLAIYTYMEEMQLDQYTSFCFTAAYNFYQGF